MSRALLDVNVLLALLDSDHVDHERARLWLGREIGSGWASCAITENGFVRIISQPRHPSPVPAAQAMARLAQRDPPCLCLLLAALCLLSRGSGSALAGVMQAVRPAAEARAWTAATWSAVGPGMPRRPRGHLPGGPPTGTGCARVGVRPCGRFPGETAGQRAW